MRTITTLLLSLLLASCGLADSLWERKGGAAPRGEEFIPTLTGNTEADIERYAVNIVEKAEITPPPGSGVTIQQIGATAVWSLLRSPIVGTFPEGNIDNVLVVTLKALNVPNRTLVPFQITGIDADDIQAMILNGASVPVALAGYFDLGAQGAQGYANLAIIFKADAKTEGTETLTLSLISAQLQLNATVQATIEDTSRAAQPPIRPPPQYTLNRIPGGTVNEGNLARPLTILLNTVGVDQGSTVPWVITGIDADDIESMTVNGIPQAPALGGSFIVGGQGSAGMVLIFKADNRTEGLETMVLGLPTIDGVPQISVQIADTSTTPPVPPPPVLTYALTRTPASGTIPEGNSSSVLSIRLRTENVAAGTAIPFTISGTGITAGDIETMVSNGENVTPTLTGNMVVGAIAPNYTSVELVFRRDTLTEGTETLQFAIGVAGVAPITVQIEDTSLTPQTDTVVPMILVTNATLLNANNETTISGTAADNVGVVRVNWTNRTTATTGVATLTAYGNLTAWSAVVPLDVGVNELEFVAVDAVGLSSSPATYTAAGPQPPAPPPPLDQSAPTIQITEQTAITADSTVTIWGVSTDNDRVEGVTWVNRNGATVVSSGMVNGINNTGNTTWFATINLQAGVTNDITFTVRDRAANATAVVVSIAGPGTSGQTSFEGGSSVPTDEIVNFQAFDDAQYERAVKEMHERQRREYEREMRRMREIIEEENTLRVMDGPSAIDLTSLKIPPPPAEVHPCNRGWVVQWGEAPLIHIADVGRYDTWRLLVTRTQFDVMNVGFPNPKYHEDGAWFYWIKRLDSNTMGMYDTGIGGINRWALGDARAKLRLGHATLDYEWVARVHYTPLPPSRDEPCEPGRY